MILDRIDPAKIVVTDCRYGRMMVLSNDRYMGDVLQRTGEYSESEVDLWRQLLGPDAKKMVACDVGTNIGAHTVPLAQMCGFVYAFEPLPFMYRLMVGNVALNGLPNVLPVMAAVGEERGTIIVPAFDYTGEDNFGGIALGTHQQGNPATVVKLDDVVRVAHFLKVDVEGMELAVLKGAQRIIRECRPILYFECNPEEGHEDDWGPKQRELIGWVQGQGYDCWFHAAPHFNPDNRNGVGPKDEHEATVVSYNVLALPEGLANRIEGLPKIERMFPPEGGASDG